MYRNIESGRDSLCGFADLFPGRQDIPNRSFPEAFLPLESGGRSISHAQRRHNLLSVQRSGRSNRFSSRMPFLPFIKEHDW